MRTDEIITTGRRRRRLHSDLFKLEAVGACQQEGVSLTAVAIARGVNPSLLRKWVRDASQRNAPIAIQPTNGATPRPIEDFVPIPLAAQIAERPIRIEVRRAGRSVSIEWPACAAQECALLLKELMK